MQPQKDIRRKQRFQNFEKAIGNLEGAVLREDLSELERAGVILYHNFKS